MSHLNNPNSHVTYDSYSFEMSHCSWHFSHEEEKFACHIGNVTLACYISMPHLRCLISGWLFRISLPFMLHNCVALLFYGNGNYGNKNNTAGTMGPNNLLHLDNKLLCLLVNLTSSIFDRPGVAGAVVETTPY